MDLSGNLAFGLGFVLFSFLITSLLIVPFINFLYRFRMTRRKQAPKKGKVPLFDKLYDVKAGTPEGGGVLLIAIVVIIFLLLIPFASHMGVYIRSSYAFEAEIFVILFSFISFGLLGLSDDLVKLFGKPKKGALGMWFGIDRKRKLAIQLCLAGFIGYILYHSLGIHILHIPLIDVVVDLGAWYVPFAAFVIVAFTNAFNITDGLDGLASGLLLICLVAFGAISATSLDTPLSVFIALWVGSLIAFLYFNVWPARLILGDSGALSFGATLAVIGLLTGSIIALVVIGGVFVVEIASSAIQIISWRFYKRPILPLAPVHHSFLAKGWEEPKIVMRAWLAGLVLAIFGLWLATI
jgi:phospho-N-acetylmuramoyl-pentapeptide-transferase